MPRKIKFLLLCFVFFISTAFSSAMLSTKTLMINADKYDGQTIDIMGVVDKIQRVEGPWSYGYFYEISLYLSVDKNIKVLTQTTSIPKGLQQGALIKVHGKFHIKGKFARYDYDNFIDAEKILSLEAV